MRQALAVVGLFVVLGAQAALAQDGPPGQDAYRAAVEKAKGAPVEQAVAAYEAVVKGYPATEYAGQALMNISAVYLVAKQYDKSLEYADRTLTEYPAWYLAGQAVRRKCVVYTGCLDQPQKTLDLLQEAMPKYAAVMLPQDLAWLPCYQADAWIKLGNGAKALEVLRQGVVQIPQALDQPVFTSRYILALLAAGETAQALSAAKGAYACCRMRKAEVDNVSDLVVQSFLKAGEVGNGTQFLAAQSDATKANPLAEVPWPEINSADKATMLNNCHGNKHVETVVLLYCGQVSEAFIEATTAQAQFRQIADVASYVDDVARCLKAKDFNMVRANAYLQYAIDGKGENPAANF